MMNKAEREKKFWNILHEMRRYYGHGIATMGSCCTEGCNNYSRGGGTCPDCLAVELEELLGSKLVAATIHFHTQQVHAAVNKALEILE